MSTLCVRQSSRLKSSSNRNKNLFMQNAVAPSTFTLPVPVSGSTMNDAIFAMSPDTESPKNTHKRLHFSSSSVGSSADSQAEPKTDTPLTDTFLKRARITESEPKATKSKPVPTSIDTPPAVTKPTKETIYASRDQIHSDLMMQCDKNAHRIFQTSCGYEFGALPMSLVRADATQEILAQLEDTLFAICGTTIDEHTYEQTIMLHSRLINTLATVSTVCDEVQEKMKKRQDAKNK